MPAFRPALPCRPPFCKCCMSRLKKPELPVRDAGMYLRSVQPADVKVPAAASSKDEAFLPVVLHLVEKPEAPDQVFRLVALPDTAFVNLCLVDLPVVAAHFLLEEHFPAWCGVRMAADAPCVDIVFLGQSVTDPGALGDITVGHMHHTGSVLLFQPAIHRPPHDPHKGRVIVPVAALYTGGELYRSLMVSFVAGTAQRHQVVR